MDLGSLKPRYHAVFARLLLSFLLFPVLHTQASVHLEGDSYDRKYGAALGIQFPTGPALELNYRPNQNYSFGISGGGISLGDLQIDQGAQQNGVGNSINTLAFETKARWHAMEKAFFIGSAVGWQNLKVTGIDGNSSNSGGFSRFYFTPHIGWIWVLNSGITIGTELGVQVPVTRPNVTQTGLSASSSKMLTDISRTVLPYLTLIKLGYSF